MKLKYKKMIIMVSMFTMGIGLVTFSIAGPMRKDMVNAKEQVTQDEPVVSMRMADEDLSNVNDNTDKEILSASIDTEVTDTTNNVEVSALTVEDNTLQLSENDELNNLIQKYLEAKIGKDITKFDGLVSDTSLINMQDLERRTAYIEKYENNMNYIKRGPEVGSYIVYAYHEVKFTSIETLAPAMNEFLVKTNEQGKLYIYIGDIDIQMQDSLTEARNSEEVFELIVKVNEDLKKALESDQSLHEFYVKLEESANQVVQNN